MSDAIHYEPGAQAPVCYTVASREECSVKESGRQGGEKRVIMAKTYRALGIVAIVTLLVLIVQVFIIANTRISGLPEPPPAFPVDSGPIWFYTTYIWPVTARLYAPIIATFSIVAAGQTRRWGWLAVFIVTGLIGVFGATMFFYFAVTLGMAGASPNTMFILTQLASEVIPPAIPALAALVFAGLNLRIRPSTQGVTS